MCRSFESHPRLPRLAAFIIQYVNCCPWWILIVGSKSVTFPVLKIIFFFQKHEGKVIKSTSIIMKVKYKLLHIRKFLYMNLLLKIPFNCYLCMTYPVNCLMMNRSPSLVCHKPFSCMFICYFRALFCVSPYLTIPPCPWSAELISYPLSLFVYTQKDLVFC